MPLPSPGSRNEGVLRRILGDGVFEGQRAVGLSAARIYNSPYFSTSGRKVGG